MHVYSKCSDSISEPRESLNCYLTNMDLVEEAKTPGNIDGLVEEVNQEGNRHIRRAQLIKPD